MSTKLITILIIIILVIVGAWYLYLYTNKPVSPESLIDPVTFDNMTGEEVEEENKEGAMMDEDGAVMTGSEFTGKVFAGSKSLLLDFNQADYEKALTSDKLIVLYFYANWCPICRAEFPKMEAAFDSLDTDQVIGFRVNYNDNDTDKDEKNLAREHGVAYQHTKVFIKKGERVLKAPDSWDTARYIEEINNNL